LQKKTIPEQKLPVFLAMKASSDEWDKNYKFLPTRPEFPAFPVKKARLDECNTNWKFSEQSKNIQFWQLNHHLIRILQRTLNSIKLDNLFYRKQSDPQNLECTTVSFALHNSSN